MLITILANLVMQGGVVPPPIPTQDTGDGFRGETKRYKYFDEEQKELEEEHESILNFIQCFVISNN